MHLGLKNQDLIWKDVHEFANFLQMPGPAEPGYVLPLQSVQSQISWLLQF